MTPLGAAAREQLKAAVPGLLQRAAGGFLRNTVTDERTCEVCRTPAGTRTCSECSEDRLRFPGRLADATGFMTYGVDPDSGHKLSQSGEVMYGYKNQRPLEEHLQLVKTLAAAGLVLHTPCLGRLPGSSLPTRWATVPSRRSRPDHPLRAIADNLRTEHAIEAPLVATGPKSRQVTPDAFSCPATLDDQHVLLLEDTWTRGATAQSAALALRSAGASRVSVLVIARWIKPKWNNNGAFLDSLPDYDATICPWTGEICQPQDPALHRTPSP